MRRRIEITTVERERIVCVANGIFCTVCRQPCEMLTTKQAAALAGVKPQSIRRWLSNNLAHGTRTCSGQHRVCKNSLFEKPAREKIIKSIFQG
jgi:hypothetical protein